MLFGQFCLAIFVFTVWLNLSLGGYDEQGFSSVWLAWINIDIFLVLLVGYKLLG